MRTQARGVAVVMAMAVVALAAIAATAILVTQSTWSRRAGLSADRAQAQQLLEAGSDWARAALGDDRRLGNVDHAGEPWALRLPPIPLENGELAGSIQDQQGAFNVNNLTSSGKLNLVQYRRFQRLLAILGLPDELADALVDWMDADSLPQPRQGAEDHFYLTLEPAYRAANRPLIDIDELALIRGFDPGVRSQLAPYVTALPEPSAINVNTATPEVLASWIDGLALDDARELVAQRKHSYFRANTDFHAALGKSASVPDQDIRIGSDYFLATMRVSHGAAQARGQVLLARLETGRWPMVVWRKYQ